MNILVFGASIVFGKADTKGGWVQRLRTYIEEKGIDNPDFDIDDIDVYNLGINGGTSEHLLGRIETETKPRMSENKTVIMISIGMNDSQFENKVGKNRVPEEQYKKNLRKVVKIAKSLCDEVIFVGITPVDERKVDPIPWRRENSYLNRYVEKYNQIMARVAKEEKIDFIDLWQNLNNAEYIDMLYDGVHPKDVGHEKIFEIIKKELEEKRII